MRQISHLQVKQVKGGAIADPDYVPPDWHNNAGASSYMSGQDLGQLNANAQECQSRIEAGGSLGALLGSAAGWVGGLVGALLGGAAAANSTPACSNPGASRDYVPQAGPGGYFTP